MLESLNRRDKAALGVGAAAVVLFILLDFVVLPFFDRLPERRRELEQKELALQRYQRLVAQAGGEQAKLTTADERLRALEGGLLESATASLANAEWQQLVRELAQSRGIELVRSEFLRQQGLGSNYTLVSGQVQFRCRVEELVNFLVALATAPKLLGVSRLRVSAVPNDREKRVNVDMRVSAVMRAEKPPAGAAPGKQT